MFSREGSRALLLIGEYIACLLLRSFRVKSMLFFLPCFSQLLTDCRDTPQACAIIAPAVSSMVCSAQNRDMQRAFSSFFNCFLLLSAWISRSQPFSFLSLRRLIASYPVLSFGGRRVVLHSVSRCCVSILCLLFVPVCRVASGRRHLLEILE